jgi:FKBP-type peptidyl-prolyl cis-trans isomerase FkpA
MKRFLLLAVAALSLAGCSLETTAPTGSPDPSDPATETFNPNMNIVISQMTKTEAGCYFRDVAVGGGAVVTGNTIVTVSYLGLLKDGSVFSQVISATVPLNQLVGGLQDAMRGMKAGGERIIVVPSALGYGPATYNTIPRNSTLVFDVRLEAVVQ